LRLHIVHRQGVEETVGRFAGRGDANRMRMVVDGANLLNRSKQTGIYGGGRRRSARLKRAERRSEQDYR
jgi:hypothetical protein